MMTVLERRDRHGGCQRLARAALVRARRGPNHQCCPRRSRAYRGPVGIIASEVSHF